MDKFSLRNIPKNKWTMVAFTKDGGMGAYWLNGQLVSSSIASKLNEYAGIDLAIGGDWRDRINTKNGRYFNGEIGQVAIYNRALTAQEMMQNYEKTKSNYSS